MRPPAEGQEPGSVPYFLLAVLHYPCQEHDPLSVKIVAIADTHYATGSLEQCGARRSAIADVLLLRAVRRLNRFIKPDITVLLGDLVDDGAREGLERLKSIIDLLEAPAIVIPGNHDGDVDTFYSVYQRPPEYLDIKGVRIVPFIDREEPGYNARRSAADIARMTRVRFGHDGPIISLQHVPLFAPGASASPYGYTNADAVWSAFEHNSFTLALSGHWHPGDDLASRGAVIVPALCEWPFAFMEITIEEGRVETRRHELALPRDLGLIDYHVHTQFAYCSENMDMDVALSLAREYGLAKVSLTEHSGQLYFDPDTFWSASFLRDGIETQHGRSDRMAAFLAQAARHRPPALIGLEIDCDDSGNPVVRPEDMAHLDVRVGAIHWLQELRKPNPDYAAAADEMLSRLSVFLGCGIQILAHPLRLFRSCADRMPPGLVPRLVELLRQHGVAAEVNFHNQETSPEFIHACARSGVKVAFGSDAHNLYEVGEFYPHLEVMRRAGLTDADLTSVLYRGS